MKALRFLKYVDIVILTMHFVTLPGMLVAMLMPQIHPVETKIPN